MNTFCCFKYRVINKNLLDSLIKSRFYFAKPESLNDPFDCNIDILRVVKHAIGKADGTLEKKLVKFYDDHEMIERFRSNINEYGIGSFSLNLDETLMWSHYGENHKGVCIRYDFPRSFLENEDQIVGASKVKYRENHVSEWITNNISLYESDHFSFVTGLLKIVLTSKAPVWYYEEEYRIIRPVAGLYNVPRSSLTNIVFGLQTSKEDKQLITSIANKYYDNIKFGRVVRNSNDFGIEIEEI